MTLIYNSLRSFYLSIFIQRLNAFIVKLTFTPTTYGRRWMVTRSYGSVNNQTTVYCTIIHTDAKHTSYNQVLKEISGNKNNVTDI